MDDEGRRWRRDVDFLEPSEVRDLLEQRVAALVEWCGGGKMPRPVTIQEGELEGTILPTLLDRERAAKKMRKRKVPYVFVPELWRHGEDELIIFVEGDPAPR